MVYYLKYRPQKISDLDSENVRNTLASLLSGNNIPHAFLFTGPKGLGKTSAARIVSKTVNCLKRKSAEKGKESVEPCNKCEQCISITEGRNMDVMEIDAASNRGIDEIRELKEKIKLAPFSANKKVYIVDEVHMLTTEAFNALLKTLEEPPAHAMFILCTTEPHKIPSTIRSRCHHIAFRLATNDDLVRSFKRIVEAEKIKIDEDALDAIASLSDGGFRDGVKELEEVVGLSDGKKITKEIVESTYRSTNFSQYLDGFFVSISKNDLKSCIKQISEMVSEGLDIKYFLSLLLQVLHTEMMLCVGIGDEKSRKTNLSLQQITRMLGLLQQAISDMRYAVYPHIVFELFVVEFLSPESKDYDEKVKPEISSEMKKTIVKAAEEVTISTLRKTVGNREKLKALYGEEKKEQVDEKENVKVSGIELTSYKSDSDTDEWINNFWQNIISETKTHNHTLAGLLRGCILKSYDRRKVVIEAQYEFHRDKLSQAKTMTMLQDICKKLTGNSLEVEVVLRDGKK